MAHASGDGIGKMFVDNREREAWTWFEVDFLDFSKKCCWSWAEHTGMKVSGEVLYRFGIMNES